MMVDDDADDDDDGDDNNDDDHVSTYPGNRFRPMCLDALSQINHGSKALLRNLGFGSFVSPG